MSEWYEEIAALDCNLQQGDILERFPVVPTVLDKPSLEAIFNGDEPSITAEIHLVDVIVMTQSCDLSNDKVTSVVLCPVDDFKLWISQLPGANANKRKSYENAVRKGQIKGLYLLCGEPQFDLPERIIDFRVVYTTHIHTIRAFLCLARQKRYRYSGVPRTDLSKSFGDFFARPALPERPSPVPQ